MNIDTHQLKQQSDIVSVIDSFWPLKKQGKEYIACCPFHNEKTPSFTVNQDKQFYYCFGCGANGDAIDFLTKYNGWDFFQASKYLGADIDAQPIESVIRNEQRKMITRYRLPPDHSEDAEMAAQMIGTSSELIPVSTPDGEVVNVYSLKLRKCMLGNSYNAAHWIIKNNRPSAAVVTSLELGNTIASIYGLNVAVCFSGAIMKYLCKWNHRDWKLKPVISFDDDDYLCYEMPWLKWDGERLNKMDILA